jgi:hypothetical protein
VRGLCKRTCRPRPASARESYNHVRAKAAKAAGRYRVWLHPERGAPDEEEGSDYYFPFATYAEAAAFYQDTPGAEEPLALIRQAEYIAEPQPGDYRHVKEIRIVEWPLEFLRRPRRTPNTIPDFLSPDAPKNRLDIIRGLASRDE